MSGKSGIRWSRSASRRPRCGGEPRRDLLAAGWWREECGEGGDGGRSSSAKMEEDLLPQTTADMVPPPSCAAASSRRRSRPYPPPPSPYSPPARDIRHALSPLPSPPPGNTHGWAGVDPAPLLPLVAAASDVGDALMGPGPEWADGLGCWLGS